MYTSRFVGTFETGTYASRVLLETFFTVFYPMYLSRVLLEKLTVAQADNKLYAVYRTQSLIATSKQSATWSYTEPIHTVHFEALTPTLILFSHLRLDHSSTLISQIIQISLCGCLCKVHKQLTYFFHEINFFLRS